MNSPLEGRLIKYKVLPFGLALAPRTFKKCMDAALAPLRLHGIRVLNYLDDWLILAHSRESVSCHRDVVIHHVHALELRTNTNKNVLYSSQQTVFFGVHMDSLQIQARLAPFRISSLKTCLVHFKLDHYDSVSTLRPHGRSLLCAAPGVTPHEAVPLVDEAFRVLLHSTSHSLNQGVAQLLSHPFDMAKPPFSPEWSQNGCDLLLPNSHDRRIPDRLGCRLRWQTRVWSLDRRICLLAHELPGAENFLAFPPVKLIPAVLCRVKERDRRISLLAHELPGAESFLAFPPVKLTVLCRVKESGVRVLLVAPFWPSQTWFSELIPLLYRPPWEIPIRQDLLSQLQGKIWHPQPEIWKLWVWSIQGHRF